MNKTNLTLGITTLALGGLFVLPLAANAYQGDPNVKGPDYSPERHQEMEKAFENNDYQAWTGLMEGKGRVTQVVNEGNFAKFAEAHELAEKGDMEGSKQIREELGLGLKDGSGSGSGEHAGQGDGQGQKRNQ